MPQFPRELHLPPPTSDLSFVLMLFSIRLITVSYCHSSAQEHTGNLFYQAQTLQIDCGLALFSCCTQGSLIFSHLHHILGHFLMFFLQLLCPSFVPLLPSTLTISVLSILPESSIFKKIFCLFRPELGNRNRIDKTRGDSQTRKKGWFWE